MNIVAAEREMKTLYNQVNDHRHFDENSVHYIAGIAKSAKAIALEHPRKNQVIDELDQAIETGNKFLNEKASLSEHLKFDYVMETIRPAQHGIALWLGLD